MEGQCAGCEKERSEVAEGLSRCTACQEVYYCGQDCQKKHWTDHKLVCKLIPNARQAGYAKQVIKEGNGQKFPKSKQNVKVHYTGTLLNGKQFDSSRERAPFNFVIGKGQVIKGWDEGVATMSVGERSRFVLSPNYGYGARGAGDDIPPNSFLVFDVELLEC